MLLNRLNSIESWDPFWEINQLERKMNQVFSNYRDRNNPQTYPPLNVWEGDDGIILTSELPGLEAGDIDISVEGDLLTLKGVKKPTDTGENDTFIIRERLSGEFSRTVRLPYHVNTDQIDAKFKNGVLTLRMNRPEDEKPRKISVKAE